MIEEGCSGRAITRVTIMRNNNAPAMLTLSIRHVPVYYAPECVLRASESRYACAETENGDCEGMLYLQKTDEYCSCYVED